MIIDTNNPNICHLFRSYSSDIKHINTPSAKQNSKEILVEKYNTNLNSNVLQDFYLATDTKIYVDDIEVDPNYTPNDITSHLFQINDKILKYKVSILFTTNHGYEILSQVATIKFSNITNEHIKNYLTLKNDEIQLFKLDIQAATECFSHTIEGDINTIKGISITEVTKNFMLLTRLEQFKHLGSVGNIPTKIDVYRVATRGIIKYNNQYVFLRTKSFISDESCLDSPGGGLYFVENIEHAFIREIKEELGFSITNIFDIGIIDEYVELNRSIIGSYTKLTKQIYFFAEVVATSKHSRLDYELECILGEEYIDTNDVISVLNNQILNEDITNIWKERELLAHTSFIKLSQNKKD